MIINGGELVESKTEFSERLNQVSSGDATALSQFIKLYRGRTYSIADSICHHREDTEDIIQEVFMKLYMLDPGKFPTTGHASWFYRLTKNTTLDYLKVKKPTDNMDIIQFSDTHAETELAYFEHLDYYEHLVSNLSSEEKLVVGLKVLGGMKHKEIAAMLKKPSGTIQWIYHKAIHALRISMSALLLFISALLFTMNRNGRAMANQDYIFYRDPHFWVGWVMVLSGPISIYFFIKFIQQKQLQTK